LVQEAVVGIMLGDEGVMRGGAGAGYGCTFRQHLPRDAYKRFALHGKQYCDCIDHDDSFLLFFNVIFLKFSREVGTKR
jgi:hypothetical protein